MDVDIVVHNELATEIKSPSGQTVNGSRLRKDFYVAVDRGFPAIYIDLEFGARRCTQRDLKALFRMFFSEVEEQFG